LKPLGVIFFGIIDSSNANNLKLCKPTELSTALDQNAELARPPLFICRVKYCAWWSHRALMQMQQIAWN